MLAVIALYFACCRRPVPLRARVLLSAMRDARAIILFFMRAATRCARRTSVTRCFQPVSLRHDFHYAYFFAIAACRR